MDKTSSQQLQLEKLTIIKFLFCLQENQIKNQICSTSLKNSTKKREQIFEDKVLLLAIDT